MIACKFRGLLPIWNYSFLPLPIENLGILGRPAISRPIRHGIGCIASWTSRESDDNSNFQTLRQLHGATKNLRVALCNLGVRMNRITVTTKCGHLNVAVFKLLFPGPQLGIISE